MTIASRIFPLLLFFIFLSTTAKGQAYFTLSNGCIDTTSVAVAFTGETEITTCSADGTSDRIRFATSNLYMAYGYVVVDVNDIIVSIGFSNFIDFETLPAGQLRVYAFSNYGLITAAVGDDFNTAQLAVPCFGLTTNFVTVNNVSPDNLMIATPTGQTEFFTCPGDGIPDIVSFSSDTGFPNMAYIVTDANNQVLAINTTGTVDFDGAGTGQCLVYVAGYSGNLLIEVGDQINAGTAVSDDCGGLSSNFITVNREGVAGGTVATSEGETMIMLCPGDGNPDIFTFSNTGASGSSFTYIITDDNNTILGIPDGNEVNFENAGEGTCRLWGLAYEGELLATAGDVATAIDLASGCFDLSDNFVTVIREVPQGGTVTTADGETELSICPDGNPDVIAFVSDGASGGEFTYVVTDDNNIILAVPDGNEIDFDGAGVGVCRLWGLSYQGELTAMLGGDASTVDLASGCFDLSDNFVTVIRSVPNGGTVSTVNGETEVTTCPGDGISDAISFMSTGAEGSNFAYVVTDSENVILGLPTASEVDFEGAGEGVCRLWGLAYEGDLLANVGDNAGDVQLASGCFALSSNFVTITRIEAEGGSIATTNGETSVETCAGDGNADLIAFETTDGSGPSIAYIVTDSDNVILDLPPGNEVDFDEAGAGICRVWSVSYDGDLLANIGDVATEIQLATGCAALSDNFVTVTRIEPDAGTVSTEDGATMVMTCPGDGVPDIITVDSTGTSLERFNYVITDENNVILVLPFGDQFNLDGAGVGVCRIWGLGYDGVVVAAPGDTVGVNQLASECFALSDNFITVIRETPTPGTVSTESGETEIFICPGDGLADIVRFDSSGVDGGAFAYVVTDDENNILALPESDQVDFESAGLGTCRLWGLVYQGNLLAMAGDNAGTDQLADGCFALSDNFVTVNRQDVVGGTVSIEGGGAETSTCPGDGLADVITFASSGATGPSFTYLVTDNNNVVLGIPGGNSQDFEGAGEGICLVWGLAYTGDLLVEVGDTLTTIDLSTGCFDLSDNVVTVTRTEPDAGEITTLQGDDDINICGGDGIPDVITFSSPGSSDGNYLYVVTQQGFILAPLDGNSFNFDNALGGTYEVYGLAYTGTPIIIPGDNILEVDLATSCFELTEEAITINIEQVDACELTATGSEGDFVYLCPQNPEDGFVEFFTCSTLSDTNYQYVITTDGDVIIALLDSNSFDFGALPLMEARVYAISYTGNLVSPLIGTNVTTDVLSDGCFAFTDNFITITNEQPEAGQIALADGTQQPFCVANGDGLVEVTTTSESLAGYVILVTDENNVVLSIANPSSVDVSELAPGNYRFWGLSYTGNLTIEVGDDADLVPLSNNCFQQTTDFIPFERAENIEGGILSTSTGTDTFYVCPMDGTPDLLVANTSITGVPYRFVVTDENGSIIIPDIISNIIPFDAATPGICRVYGFAFSGNVTSSFGLDIENSALSDSCYALSENFITVIRQTPVGGTVATIDGETEVTVGLNSGNTTVEAVASGQADLLPFTYLITDENNVVLGMGDGPVFDFADAGVGVCRIWGLSYQGDLLVDLGNNIDTTTLSSDCFSLSENFITVTRTEDGLQSEENDLSATQLAVTPYPNPVAWKSTAGNYREYRSRWVKAKHFVRGMNGRAWAVQEVAWRKYKSCRTEF